MSQLVYLLAVSQLTTLGLSFFIYKSIYDNPHFEGLLAEPNGLIHLKYLARETHSTVAVLIQDKPFARNFVIRGSKALDKISGSQLSEDQGTKRDVKY